ncbi:hypothetical protein AC579_2253 [Pseudocercospora musae]|uniref:NlpC/P60 domain-containing protein n=1 Tax=Pseudocercospora musae TaxID=113226 RepID=A0A139IVF8_9PEZI|nr:hypothetical protein AC579_2253 [Pseudocercospora musae]
MFLFLFSVTVSPGDVVELDAPGHIIMYHGHGPYDDMGSWNGSGSAIWDASGRKSSMMAGYGDGRCGPPSSDTGIGREEYGDGDGDGDGVAVPA